MLSLGIVASSFVSGNPGDGTVDPGSALNFEWWASDLTALNDGDVVGGEGARWTPHAGPSELWFAGGAPTLRLVAGVRVVRFVAATGDGLGLTSGTSGGQRSIYAVVRCNSLTAGGATIVGGDSYGSLQFRFNPVSGGMRLNLVRQNQAEIITGATAVGTSWHLVECHTNASTSHEVVLDGVVDGTSTSSSTFGAINRVGRQGSGEFLDADVAAICISTTVHDSATKAAQRARLHAAFSLLIGP